MYIEEISISNLRVFSGASASFQYPGRLLKDGERELEHPNLNLILGNNGTGKSSLLKAIGLAALGPLVLMFSPYMLVRRRPGGNGAAPNPATLVAMISVGAQFSWQDRGRKKPDSILAGGRWEANVLRQGDEESVEFIELRDPILPESKYINWKPIHSHASPAFFAVGYGATRRVDTDPSAATPAQKMKSIPPRHQRIQSLFTEGYTLVSLGHWLPALRSRNPGRFKQVCTLINALLPEGIEFTTKTDSMGEYLFAQSGSLVPFAALSDGCRAFIGWVADMLYHICFGCPSGVKLVDNCGIVLVDEIDLHLHPEWQRTILPKLARTFPNLQFIVTSHSPIVVGTLQRENIWVCEPAADGDGSVLVQKDTGVHGLSADQILLTEYFGLETSRAPEKQKRLRRIAAAAERKTPGKADAFLKSLVTAMEDEAEPVAKAPMKRTRQPAARPRRK